MGSFCISDNAVEIFDPWPLGGFNVPMSVVIKISAILKANTVKTGAKMTDKILFRSNCFLIDSGRLSVLSNTDANTTNGDAAIIIQRNQTLIISTTASASNGKKSIIAKAVLMSISHDTLPKLCPQVSDISAKLSNEE